MKNYFIYFLKSLVVVERERIQRYSLLLFIALIYFTMKATAQQTTPTVYTTLPSGNF